MNPQLLSLDYRPVRQLVDGLGSPWSALHLAPLATTGTDNALFRLGDQLLLRLPRRAPAAAYLTKELDWLPHLAGLPLEVPCLRLRGRADLEFPSEFGIVDWIEGQVASPDKIADPEAAARSLGQFLNDLHLKSTAGAPRAGAINSHRGAPLHDLTDITRLSIDSLAGEIDTTEALAVWEAALAEPHHCPPVWLHGDLKADNLIARGGKLHAVLDWGLAAIGDPAADYAAAWSWIEPEARDLFRDECSIDDSDWNRARGWALYGAVVALSFYRGGKNEALCRQSRHTLGRLGVLT